MTHRPAKPAATRSRVPRVLVVGDHRDRWMRELVEYVYEDRDIEIRRARTPALARRLLADSAGYAAVLVSTRQLTPELLEDIETCSLPALAVGDRQTDVCDDFPVLPGNTPAQTIVRHTTLRISGGPGATGQDASPDRGDDASGNLHPFIVFVSPPGSPGASVTGNFFCAAWSVCHGGRAPVLLDLSQTAPTQHFLCGLPEPDATVLDMFGIGGDADELIANSLYRTSTIERPAQLLRRGLEPDIPFAAGTRDAWSSVTPETVRDCIRRIRRFRPVVADLDNGRGAANPRVRAAVLAEATTTAIVFRADPVGIALLREWLAEDIVTGCGPRVFVARAPCVDAVAETIVADQLTRHVGHAVAVSVTVADDHEAIAALVEAGLYGGHILEATERLALEVPHAQEVVAS